MKTERLAHPSDSPGMSPCNFWFVGWAKIALQNRRFADADAVVEGKTDLFDTVTFEELQSVFQNWIERLEWVVTHNGEYLMK
jgi:G3E family GTPase